MPESSGESTELDDFDRVVALLNKHSVDYLIIGGYAVIFYGHVRNTKDLDIIIRSTPENASRAVAALEEAGFACPELTPELFTAGKGITFKANYIGLEDLIANKKAAGRSSDLVDVERLSLALKKLSRSEED